MVDLFELIRQSENIRRAKRKPLQRIWEDYIQLALLITIPIGLLVMLGILIGIYISK